MNALFNACIRPDMAGKPLQIYCLLQNGQGASMKDMAGLVIAEPNQGWVDAKELIEMLRMVADAIEKELS